MRVNVAIPESQVSAPVLDAALEAVTRLNEQMIKSGDAPTFKQSLPHVRWRPEPPGAEHFDHAGIVSARGWGDCDDLAPHHAASLRVTGEDPGARAIVIKSGPQMWHAVVKRSNGAIDDPSVSAGMKSNHAIAGAALPLMHAPQQGVSGAFTLRPQVALRPTAQGWEGRADIPWNWRNQGKPTPSEFAMSALHQYPIASTALAGAIDGAIDLGEICGGADPDHVERLKCLSDMASGMPLHECAEEYGHEHARAAHAVVGSFWSHLKHLAASPFTTPFHMMKDLAHGNFGGMLHDAMSPINESLHMAQPFAHALQPFGGLMRMVPGVGPMAASALDLANRGSMPTSFADMARFAAQEGAGFIPGVGPALSQMPFGGGFPGPQAPWPAMPFR